MPRTRNRKYESGAEFALNSGGRFEAYPFLSAVFGMNVFTILELNKEKTALDTEVQELQAEVENKAIVIIALQSQLEVITSLLFIKDFYICI